METIETRNSETIKIKSYVSDIGRKIILACAILFLTVAVIVLIIGVIGYYEAYESYMRNYYYTYAPDIFDYIDSFFIILCVDILWFIWFWAMCKTEIVVTDKRIIGKTLFSRVDLPLDSISAVQKSIFNVIAVATSSGVIRFFFIQDVEEVRKEICTLLLDRQIGQTQKHE